MTPQENEPQLNEQKLRVVIAEELKQIANRRHVQQIGETTASDVPAAGDEDFYEKAGKQDTVGLAFSGGGIRSATFNLGVLQALAKLGLLKHVDYLSTVSGGGYIGSWFAAWVQRAGEHSAGGLTAVERELHPDRIAQAAPPLHVGAKPPVTSAEPSPIFHLRRFSNYLSPKLGLMSADMWVLLATYLRNLLVCQLVLLPAVVGVLLLSRLLMLLYHTQTPEFVVGFVTNIHPETGRRLDEADQWVLGGLIVILWFIAALFAFVGSGRVRPDNVVGAEPTDKKRLTQPGLIWWVIVPLLAAAILFCWFPALRLNRPERDVDDVAVKRPEQADPADVLDLPSLRHYLTVRESNLKVFGAFASIPALVVLLAYFFSLPYHRRLRFGEAAHHARCAAASCIAGGILLFGVWYFLIWLCQPGPAELTQYVHARAAARVTTFGPPLVLGVIILTVFLGIGLMRSRLGEELREWWSSLCAWLMIFAVLWMSVNVVAIYATAVVIWAGPWLQAVLGSGWLFTVLGGVFAGGTAGTGGRKPSNTLLDLFARLAPAVFVAGLLVGVSLLIHALMDSAPNWERAMDTADWMRRNEPVHPPIRITETKTPQKDGTDKEDVKKVVVKSRVFDESAVAGKIFWLGMFNTDANFVPKAKFQLQHEDIRYLRNQRGLDPKVVAELRKIAAVTKPLDSQKEFSATYEPALKLLKKPEDRLPWEVTPEEILEVAKDAEIIEFNPGLLLVKLFVALLICLALLLFSAFVVDVNRYSLHALYGNRLIRCYLGASNRDRLPDPITGFDPGDDLKLAELRIKSDPKGPGYDGPYLLVNTTLNLVSGAELAWQERMAEAFLLSPLVCGCPDTGFCDTKIYADGLNLSTAMTISGAAASPNSGYHSSPAVTALLTVFNARLGAWLGNPKRPSRWRDQSPKGGFLYLLKELFGRTTNTSAYVYLSDGGHFENLGVYELVRRRCRYIIASDAGCDGNHVFADLGLLIAKCRSDFGIRIEIGTEALHLSVDGRVRWHCAVGKIHYKDVDFGALPGTLIYLKPSLTGDESTDILHYAAQNPDFPHETTADQFFGESQFESYRALGQHIAEGVFTEALTDMKADMAEGGDGGGHRCACRAFFSSIVRRWFAMPPAYESSFRQITADYLELQRSMAGTTDLNPITLDMYPELAASLPEEAAGVKSIASVARLDEAGQACVELHTLLRMLKIMESAWLSLDLDVHYAHPLNRGWMDIFHRWTSAKSFRKNWPMLRSEFSRRFVDFCEKQMRIGRVVIEARHLPANEHVPEILDREFGNQWPEPKFHGLQRHLEKSQGAGQCWLIYSRMENAVGQAPPPSGENPLGIIMANPVSPAPAEPIYEFLIWIRGPYRNTGIGRQAVRQVLQELRAAHQDSFRLRVRLPVGEITGPGGELLKAMWLTFFNHFEFSQIPNPTKGRAEEITLERRFPAQT